MATTQAVLNHFRSEIGYVEGPNNSTKFAKEAGHANNQPWCATFIVAMFRRAGMKLPSESAYTPAMYDGLKAKGRAIDGPRVGALAFLYFPLQGRIAHVGIVESLRPDGRFVTIEGNTDEAGGRTGGKVMRKVRSVKGFSFAMPVYSRPPAKTATKPAPAPAPKTTAQKNYFGDCRKLQTAVRVTADNYWGEGTEKACNAVRHAAQGKFPHGVKFAQQVVGAKSDGEWGTNSRKALRQTIYNMERALVEMSHTRFVVDGTWTTETESAYQKVRSICKRP